MPKELDLGRVVGKDAMINGQNAINLIAGKDINIQQDGENVTIGVSETIDDQHFANKDNPHEVTAEQVGAARENHCHDTDDISSGIFPIERGGTGASSSFEARNNLGITAEINDVATNIRTWMKNSFANQNLLINGSLQVWQRGESFELSGIKRAYTADRFLTFHQGECKVERFGNYIEMTINNDDVNTQTTIFECPESLFGETLTLSFYAKASDNIRAEIFIWETFPHNPNSKIKSKIIELTQELQRFSITFTVPEYLESGLINIWFTRVANARDKVIQIGKCKLEVGDIPTPFVPRSYSEELILCQRYYFRSTKGLKGTYGAYSVVLDRVLRFMFCNVRYPVPMRIKPTVTIYSVAGTKDKIGEWASGLDIEQSVTVMNSSSSNEGFNSIVKGDNDEDFVAKTYAFHVEADSEIH